MRVLPTQRQTGRKAARRRLGLALLLWLMSTALCDARAPVDYRVEVGFGGVVRAQGGIFPVTVTIDNRVASTHGLITIRQPDVGGDAEVSQVLPFTSPSPSVKRFVLYTRLEAHRDLELRVTFKRHVKPIRERLTPRKSRNPLVLCLGLPNRYGWGGADRKYRFVRVGKAEIPSDPIGLDGVHAVLLSGVGFVSLDKPRVAALRDWVQTGGTILLHDPLTDPVFISNVKRLGAAAHARAYRRGFTRLGAGLFASSGADPEAGAFWAGNEVWARVLFPDLAEKEDYVGGFTSVFGRLCRSKRKFCVSAFVWMAIIVLAYMVTIGPVDWALSRRLRRPGLTWILFPVAMVAFSFAGYGYSSLINVGTMRAVQVNILDTGLDSAVARGNTMFWLYSAKNATYSIQAPVRDVLFSAREAGGKAVARVDVLHGAWPAVSARIPIFSSKVFDAVRYVPWPYKVGYTRREGRFDVTVPSELEVEAAFLADAEVLEELRRVDTSGVGSGTMLFRSHAVRSWADVSKDRASFLQDVRMRRFGGRNSGLLPPTNMLRDYALCLSYPWPVEKDAPMQSMQFRRDFREQSLDIRSRVVSGRTLLLFLAPSNDLAPLTVEGHRPKTARLTVVRIQVPDDV